jgi:DNA polymerase-3 subunit delta
LKLSYSQLSQQLEKGPSPFYLLSGDQSLLRDQAAAKIRLAVVGENPSPFNLERFDGEADGADRVLMAANTLPLLGGRRFVLVKRAARLVEGSEELLRYASDPSPHTVLVLDLEKKPDARRKGWKELEKDAVVVTCDAPPPWELEDWVADEARARGLRLPRDSARFLIAELGSDLRRIDSELEKVSLYAGGEPLDVETVGAVLGRGKAQSVFKFLDAVTVGDGASALRQLGRLLEEGEAPLRILALIDRLVGQLRIAREHQAARKGSGNLASVLGVPPRAAHAIAESASKLDRRFLRRAVAAVAETDRILKSSRLPDRVVLESLVISLSRGRARRGSQARDEARRRERRDL